MNRSRNAVTVSGYVLDNLGAKRTDHHPTPTTLSLAPPCDEAGKTTGNLLQLHPSFRRHLDELNEANQTRLDSFGDAQLEVGIFLVPLGGMKTLDQLVDTHVN